MKIIPKPEGYELREKRSDKARDGKLWECRDALFNAYEDIKERTDVECIAIVWYERDEANVRQLRYKQAGDSDAAVRLAARYLGQMMGWDE